MSGQSQYPQQIDSFAVHQDNANETINAEIINKLQDAIVSIQNRFNVSGLSALPSTAGPAGSLCVVNKQWYISDGTTWSLVGGVQSADVAETLLTTTNATTILTYTTPSAGNYVVYVYGRVVTAQTNVTVKVTFTDGSNTVQTYTIGPQASNVGPLFVLPFFFYALANTPIKVDVTAGTANQVYASATAMGV